MTLASSTQDTKHLPKIKQSEFTPMSTSATIAELLRPIDPRHIKMLPKGKLNLSYVPWAVICLHLHHRAPGWSWDILEVKELGGYAVVSGKLSIPTTDGFISYSSVASEPMEGGSQAPPVETAASSALRRAAGLAGLGIELWC